MRINHVHLRVRNLRESVEFYSALLDFDTVTSDAPGPFGRQAMMCSQDPHMRCGFVLSQGPGCGIELSGLDHVSLEVRDTTDVDQLYAKAKAMDLRATAPRLYDGRWQFFVFDPDGYKIEVMASKPSSATDRS